MKLHIYTSTPGLACYPESERFAVYVAVHRRLMREDTAYRKRYNAYIAACVCLAVTTTGLPLSAEGLLGVPLSIVLPVTFAAVIVWLAFSQQRFMNQQIGDALQGQAANQ